MTTSVSSQEFERVLAAGGTAVVHPDTYRDLLTTSPLLAKKVIPDDRVERGQICAVEKYTPVEKMEPVKEICENCRFYIPYDRSEGICRRYPPVYTGKHDLDGTFTGAFDQPAVDAEDWCGEWKPKILGFGPVHGKEIMKGVNP
jgi:hypothetical protein